MWRRHGILLAVFVSSAAVLPYCLSRAGAERNGSKCAAPTSFALPASAAPGPCAPAGSALRGAAAPRSPSAPGAAAALPGLQASALLALAFSCLCRCRSGKRQGARVAASVVQLRAEAKGSGATAVADDEEYDGQVEGDEDLDFDEDEEDEFDDYEGDGERFEARAKAMYQNGSPMKFRRVLWQIRGRSYREALMLLEFLPWRACKTVLCCLQSAAANAQNHFNMDKSRLYISRCKAEKGPRMKRMRPVSKGQAHMYMKRTAHLTIWVAEMEDDQLDELA